MIGLPPESSRPDTLLPYTTLFRPAGLELGKEKSTNLARSVSDEPHTTLFAPDFNDPYVGGVTRDPQNDADAEAESIRSEEHTSELQSLMRISYAVFCLTKKKHNNIQEQNTILSQNNYLKTNR